MNRALKERFQQLAGIKTLNEGNYTADLQTYKKQYNDIVEQLDKLVPSNTTKREYDKGSTVTWTREIEKNHFQYFKFSRYEDFNFTDSDFDPRSFSYGGYQEKVRPKGFFNAMKNWFHGNDSVKSKHHNGKFGGVQADIGIFANDESTSKIVNTIKPILSKIFTDSPEYK